MPQVRALQLTSVSQILFLPPKKLRKKKCGIDGPLFHREDIGTDKLIRYRVDEMRRLRTT